VKKNERPCPACGETLGPDETHWSLFPAPMGGYICPRLLALVEFTIQKERDRITEAVQGLREGKVRDHVTGREYGTGQVSRDAVLTIVNIKEVTG